MSTHDVTCQAGITTYAQMQLLEMKVSNQEQMVSLFNKNLRYHPRKTAVIGGNQFNEIWINKYCTDLNAGLQEQMVCPGTNTVQLGVEAATFPCA